MSKGYTIYVRAWSADEYPERDIAKGYVTNVHLRQEYIAPETARVLMEDNERLTAELASYKKAEPIFCGKCHKPMFANDKFCSHCGAREGEGKCIQPNE